MFDLNKIPNWMRAEALTACLVEQVKGMTKEEVDQMFDNMLNHQAFRVDTTLTELSDSTRYYFKFIDDETPEFVQSIGHFADTETEDYLNVFHGIPYTALLAMNTSADKKASFLNYLMIIYDVLAWQTIVLLDTQYKMYQSENEDTKDYNSPSLFSAFAGQICVMLSRNDSFDKFFDEAAKGKEAFLNHLNEMPDETNYALTGIRQFVKELTDENYEKLITYCKDQYAIKQEFEKSED